MSFKCIKYFLPLLAFLLPEYISAQDIRKGVSVEVLFGGGWLQSTATKPSEFSSNPFGMAGLTVGRDLTKKHGVQTLSLGIILDGYGEQARRNKGYIYKRHISVPLRMGYMLDCGKNWYVGFAAGIALTGRVGYTLKENRGTSPVAKSQDPSFDEELSEGCATLNFLADIGASYRISEALILKAGIHADFRLCGTADGIYIDTRHNNIGITLGIKYHWNATRCRAPKAPTEQSMR